MLFTVVSHELNATQKQINYELFLLGKAGYSMNWMNAQFKTNDYILRNQK
jgi:hypothetical protein